MARDKFYEARICGYIAAYQKAKQEGLDALERDIKKRNILKADLNLKEKDMDELFNELSRNLYTNTLTAVAWTLHTVYGFGKKRIVEFKKAFDKTVQYTLDLDYLGGHFVKLEDFAVELNEMYDLGIDVNRVAYCQDKHDEGNEDFRMCKIDRVLQGLREGGFEEAAVFIEKKLY